MINVKKYESGVDMVSIMKQKSGTDMRQKPSNVLRTARNIYIRENPMSMEEINIEIERHRGEL